MAGLLVMVKTGLVERMLFVMTGGAGLMATGGVMRRSGGNADHGKQQAFPIPDRSFHDGVVFVHQLLGANSGVIPVKHDGAIAVLKTVCLRSVEIKAGCGL